MGKGIGERDKEEEAHAEAIEERSYYGDDGVRAQGQGGALHFEDEEAEEEEGKAGCCARRMRKRAKRRRCVHCTGRMRKRGKRSEC